MNSQTQQYKKNTLTHLGTIINTPTPDNLKNRLIELCVRFGNNDLYSPIKTIRVLNIKTPEGTGIGDRSGGRGKILYYLDNITNEEGKIIYGEPPDWLKTYNKNNKTYHDTSDIYVNLLPFDFVGMTNNDSNPKPIGGKKAKKQKSKKAKKQKSKKAKKQKSKKKNQKTLIIFFLPN